MRSFRRLGVGVAVTCMLAFGGVAVSSTAASAGTIGSCSKSGILATCAVSGAPSNPITITAKVTSSPDEAEISWSINCTQFTNQASSSGSFTGKTPFGHTMPHPFSRPDECGVVVTAALDHGVGSIHMTVSWSSTEPPTAIKGYGGKCADDTGNSSAERNKIQIWYTTPQERPVSVATAAPVTPKTCSRRRGNPSDLLRYLDVSECAILWESPRGGRVSRPGGTLPLATLSRPLQGAYPLFRNI